MKKNKTDITMKIVKYITPCFLILFVCILTVLPSMAQNRESFQYTVSGTVRDASSKQPLPGISISLPGISSAMTDDDGSYSIKLPVLTVVLQVSGPGYTGREVSVRGRESIDLELYEEGFKSAFDPIVTPLGEESPLKVLNSWTPIKEDAILSTATTADAILQGKVAGLNVVYRSGAPGNGSNISLRGLNTMHAGSMPLYIVDGIPFENSSYSSSLIGNNISNPLASIDIKDIESVTVMKDGTSLYGVKGANGVILIRTIQSKDPETKINFRAHTGVNFEPSNWYPMLNSSDQKLLLSDILQSQGMSSSEIQSQPYLNNQLPEAQKWGYTGNTDYYRYNHNTNWQKDLFKPSFNQSYYMNVFGGDDVALYALSVGFLDQNGAVKETNYQRFNTRFNSEIRLSTKFRLISNMSFVYSTRKMIDESPYKNTNVILASLVKSPFMAVDSYDAEGNKSPIIEDFDIFNNSNPHSLIKDSKLENIQYRFTGNVGAELELTDEFKLNALLAINYNKDRDKTFYSNTGVYFDTTAISVIRNKMQHRTARLFSLYGEGYATYAKRVGTDHDLNFNLGMRYQNNKAEDDYANAYNSGSDYYKAIGYGESLLNQIGGSLGNWNWLSIYGTADYSYKNKYYAGATLAGDASSRYGRDASNFMVYPSVSGAWLLSGEEFLRNNSAFDILRLRLGWGMSGNDDIGNYSGMQYYVPQNLLGTYGLIRGNVVDLKLKPEKSNRFTVGLDASALNERVNVTLEVYHNKITDMITQNSAPSEMGFPYYITNNGAMKNTGLDFAVNTRILNGDFKWDLGLTLSTYKNEITDLKGAEYVTPVAGGEILSRVGEPLGVFYGYKTNGVYSTQADADADGLGILVNGSKVAFGAGDVRFVNQNKDAAGIIDENDRVIIGDPNPDLYGSISNTFRYKRWDLNIFMTYSIGNDVYNCTRAQLESMSTFDNQTQAVKNRWRTEGDLTNIPKATFGDPMGNSRFSDRWIEDGSYLKLKRLTLAYNLPLNFKGFRNCTLFLTGENLLTFTGYKGYDPEFSLGTNPLYYGIDTGFTPNPRSLSIGFKVEL